MNNPSVKSSFPSEGVAVSRAALRLLAALGEPGGGAVPDPSRDGWVIVRTKAGGVSLGRGSHPEAALYELARHDLVAIVEGGGSFRSPAVTEPGRARLRRREGGEDAFANQHRDLSERRLPEGGTVAVNANESPLDWLRRRRGRDGEPLIDAACYEAGERLRRDLTIGGLLPSVTARWDGAIGGGGGPRDPAAAADATIAARQRARAALAVVGRDHADILVDLCGFLKGLEQIERDHGWPPRSGKVVLRLALRRLAEHYGLGAEARGPDRARTRAWHSAEERAAGLG